MFPSCLAVQLPRRRPPAFWRSVSRPKAMPGSSSTTRIFVIESLSSLASQRQHDCECAAGAYLAFQVNVAAQSLRNLMDHGQIPDGGCTSTNCNRPGSWASASDRMTLKSSSPARPGGRNFQRTSGRLAALPMLDFNQSAGDSIALKCPDVTLHINSEDSASISCPLVATLE